MIEATYSDTHPRTLTITWDAADDPNAVIQAAASRERLIEAVRLMADPTTLTALSREDARTALLRAGALAQRLDASVETAMLAARDTHGMGWGEIANALEITSRTTVRRRVAAERRARAEHGHWFDEHGAHGPDVVAAAAHVARAESGDKR